MGAKGIFRALREAGKNANRSASSHDGSKFASGLAYEGYDAGYMDALRDVEAALRGHPVPSNSRYWPRDFLKD